MWWTKSTNFIPFPLQPSNLPAKSQQGEFTCQKAKLPAKSQTTCQKASNVSEKKARASKRISESGIDLCKVWAGRYKAQAAGRYKANGRVGCFA
jgi:hypothetical protein